MVGFLIGQTGPHAVSRVGLDSSYGDVRAPIHPLCMAGNSVKASLPRKFEAAW